MNSYQQRLLPLFALLVGCGGPAINPRVASLSDRSAAKSQFESGSDSAVVAEATSPSGGSTEHSDSQTKQKPTARRYTVRKAVNPSSEPSIPPVMLSAGHAKLCTVQVGDAFPVVTLPRLGGGPTELASLRGKQATVVLFWRPDRWMARTALIDMQRDIAVKFPADQVAVVGIAVRQPAGSVQAALNTAQAAFPQLIDTEGKAFAAVGIRSLPRIFVLDPTGKIVWFDIEYSEGTRRELGQTLSVLTK